MKRDKERESIFSGRDSAERKAECEKIRKVMKIISVPAVILAAAGIIYLLYPLLKGFGHKGWLEEVGERISRYNGVSGVCIYILIQAVQVVVAVIPAIQVVGGLLYGWLWGSVLSFVGILLGTIVVWGVVKKIGVPLAEAVISEKNIKKFRFLENEKRLIAILMILYLIPAVPKDVLTYIVPLTKIKMKDFFHYVMPMRIPAIVLSAFFGSSVTKGDYLTAVIIAAVILVTLLTGIFFRDRILSRKSSSVQNKQ